MKPVSLYIDPQLRTKFAAYAGPEATDITMDKIPAVRDSFLTASSLTDEALSCNGMVSLEEFMIPGPQGAPELPLLICRPAAIEIPTPAIYYVHGGAMFAGDNRLGLGSVIEWVEKLGVTIASVGYRLAPENPYPSPQEDCYAGLEWLAENGVDLGINNRCILVAGTSAGGSLAAATALMARDRSGPMLTGAMLISPMLDDRAENTASCPTTDGVFDRVSCSTAWTALLGQNHRRRNINSYAAPAREANLTGLPAAYIEVGSAEILRDETIRYAERIWAAGGNAELHVWPGATHGFDLLAPRSVIAKAARKARAGWLARIMEKPLPAD